MSDAKVRGTVHVIEDTKTYGQKGFQKRLLVLEQENERFTNYIPVEFLRDDCDSADGLQVGLVGAINTEIIFISDLLHIHTRIPHLSLRLLYQIRRDENIFADIDFRHGGVQ